MRKSLFSLLIVSLFIVSCSSDRLDVDVSSVDITVPVYRFDQKMSQISSLQEMEQANREMIEDGEELYEFYVGEMLRSGSVYDDSIANFLLYFVQDPVIQEVFADMDSMYADFSEQEAEINALFQHLAYHFPNQPMPQKLIVYNSAFNYGVTSTGNKIGLGLEMYLGKDNEIIQKLGYPLYMKDKMDETYLLTDIAHSWIMTNILGDFSGDTFLEEMIYYGKLRYGVEAALPEMNDATILRYTENEFDFAMASEYNIWQFIIDMEWIYSTDMKTKMRFFNEAPTTVGIDGSPGRIGQFMGWRMVKTFMDENEDVSLEELFFQTPDNKILKAYKPEENE